MLDSVINHVANAFGLELLHFADSFRGLGMKLLGRRHTGGHRGSTVGRRPEEGAGDLDPV